MKCPYCAAPDTRVTDSRPADDDSSIRRRRECNACEKRFTTYEVVERAPLWVIKRSGGRELFDRQKILSGLVRACAHRPVPLEQLEQVAQSVERAVRQQWEKEVASEQIGERVMAELANIDQVGYVRFASVYRKFDGIDSFKELLDEIYKK